MMDLIMLGVLLVCFGAVKLFADWCQKVIKEEKK